MEETQTTRSAWGKLLEVGLAVEYMSFSSTLVVMYEYIDSLSRQVLRRGGRK